MKSKLKAQSVRRIVTSQTRIKTARAKREASAARSTVRKDPIDLRDRMYEPPLIDLPPRLDNRKRVPKILDQGQEGSCTGFGLAATVNFLHSNRGARRSASELVSPYMLYSLAKRYDEWPGEKYEGSSIRGGMKGWLRHGVCSAKLWTASKRDAEITGGIMKDALQRPLGAYYRVRHLHLNHMHAALNETGILYVSSDVHSGWDNTDSKGRIPWSDEKSGGHAYAIVGYDEHGFWIQNSWGTDWGVGGFAHLSYDDWLENGYDCWVARPGVPTYSLALDGLARRNRVATFDYIPHEAVVMADIVDHFVDLGNDGRLSCSGRYSTSEHDVERILGNRLPACVKSGQIQSLLIYAHGGLNDEKAAASRVASMKPICLENGIYPLHFMWETGFMETTQGILQDALRSKRFSGWRDDMKERFKDLLDEGIELAARPLGKALWGEMQENAKRASQADEQGRRGGGQIVAESLARHLATMAKEGKAPTVHLVGHSAGSILIAHWLEVLASLKIPVESLTLFAPACTIDLFNQRIKRALQPSQTGAAIAPAIQRFLMFNLEDNVERDDKCGGVYHKSLLYLVSEALERERKTPLLGMTKFVEKHRPFGADVKELRLGKTRGWAKGVVDLELASKATTHGGFDNDAATLNSLLRVVLGKKQLVREFVDGPGLGAT